jgi:aspartate kinase
MIVMKFGGTSVADQAALERLMTIVRATRQAASEPEARDWRGPIVVVSALGGATDRFLAAATDAGQGQIPSAIDNLRQLRARHLEVAGIVGTSADRPAVDTFIRQQFDDLEQLIGALGVLREVTPRWLDTIAAAGELLSSRIVAAALNARGLSAEWVDARRVIVTGDEHTAAPPLMRETAAALAAVVDPILADRRIAVMGGFVGANPAWQVAHCALPLSSL